MSMRERIARAFHERGRQIASEANGDIIPRWEDACPSTRFVMEECAIEALRVMREPTEAMLENADYHTALMPDTKAEFATLYRHMIDAALNDAPSTVGEGG